MSQSLSRILVHLVFSTKGRKRFVTDDVRPQLHAYLAGACRALGSEAFRVGGTDDHVHVLCTLPRKLAVMKLTEEIKTSSSAWMKRQDRAFSLFSWQNGYGAFSLGQSQLAAALRYVELQDEHHRRRDFKAELLTLLKRYQVEYDERYLWD